MSEFQPPKGMKDIFPEEMEKRKWISAKIRNAVEKFGYREVEPTAIENFSSLAAKSGEDIKNEIYYFKDKKERELGLRFDLTVGISRMVASTEFTLPIKLSCISSMWRYDNPQYGRFRQFYQWDIEIFGSSQLEADAEVIFVSTEVMRNLGLKNIQIRVNDRKLVEGILDYLGITDRQMEGAMRTIDKISKLSKGALYEEFAKFNIEKLQAEEILNALSLKGRPKEVLKFIAEKFPKNEKIDGAIKRLLDMEGLLNAYSLKNIVYDLSIVRGIAYYTGIVFEGYDSNTMDAGAIFGGGRFDNLTKIYGKDLPAVGVAGGIERLMLALEKNKCFPPFKEKIEYYIAPVNEEMRKEAIKVASLFRKKGAVEIDLMGRALEKQFRYASKRGIAKVVVVGPSELKKGVVTVKDMKTGKEEKVKI